MLDERDEYLISRYLDGDLSAGERAHVEALLAESAAAREVLREYRQLSGLLRLSRETPAIDFEQMRDEIVSAATEPQESGRAAIGGERDLAGWEEGAIAPRRRRADAPGWTAGDWAEDDRRAARGQRKSGAGLSVLRWAGGPRALAMAASLVLASFLAWQLFDSMSLKPVTGVITSTGNGAGRLDVTGPVAAGGMASGSMSVVIGPNKGASPTILLDQQDTRYGRVEVLPDSAPALQSDPEAPF